MADVLSQTDLRDEMSKVSHPVLILHGEHDPILPIDASKRLAKLLPNGKFLEIKGHGHSLNIENPSTFVDLMRDFLS